MADALLQVEVVHAGLARCWRIGLTLPAGALVADALAQSAIAERAGLDLSDCRLGIFSQPCTPQTRLHDGDRVEIYRPLRCDPKTVRRRRAAGELS